MKKNMVFIVLFVVIIFMGVFLFFSRSKKDTGSSEISKEAQETKFTNSNMKLTGSAFENQGQIPSKYTCDAGNVSPPLTISEIPEVTRSLALIVDDPDAPVGDWVHWLVWNIDPKTTEILEGQAPEGAVQGLTDFGENNYGGPCPPSGTHRYQFKLYALDTTLNLSASSKKKELLDAIEGHILDQSLLVGTYQRQ